MNASSPTTSLSQLATTWRRRLLLAFATRASAAALFVGALGKIVFGLPPGWQLGTAVVTLGAALFLQLRFGRAWRVTARDIARHLDRIVPEFEESCELLLETEDQLPTLASLQRSRLIRRWPQTSEKVILPTNGLRVSWRYLTISAALTILVYFFMPQIDWQIAPRSTFPDSMSQPAKISQPAAIEIKNIKVDIIPPAYTRKPQHAANTLDIQVEEGGRVQWTLRASQPVERGEIVFSNGDTLKLRAGGDERWRSEKHIMASGFYFIALANTRQNFRSRFGKIELEQDHAPEVSILSPAPRTIITIADSPRVALRVRADDDYQITTAQIIATVTKGTGEGIKFRDDTLAFADRSADKDFTLFNRTLDLAKLGMAPGDELYFHIEVRDNREPAPNLARSDTRFIVLQDTAAVLTSSSAGIGVNVVPEYFRSQRQIIIDTEKLLAEETKLSDAEFAKRSNALAHDQKSLRLRYGQYLGEESESGIGLAHSHAEDAGDAEEPAHPDHGEEGQTASGSSPSGEDTWRDFVHMHDAAAANTLFSRAVRAQLKAALAQMWDAELHLRLYRPAPALPYEYRALDLLKDVQQRSRLYVRRVGFTLPPLKPDEKRLTGELDDIAEQRARRNQPAQITFPAIRAALEVLRTLETTGQPLTVPDKQTLDDAGNVLADFAAVDPGRLLPALQDLRDLLDNQPPPARDCPDCLRRLRKTFLQILPESRAVPDKKTSSRTSLVKRYFQKLGGEP